MAKTNTQFVKLALKQVGRPYVWGGASPSTGFDCSGLVEYSLSRIGVAAPRTSQAQYDWTRRVAPGQLKPGDLVFLNFPGETSPGHVMIWLGHDTVLQAPKPGDKVSLAHFSPQKPGTNEWGAQVVGYGRIKQLSYANSPASAITPSQAANPGASGGGGSKYPTVQQAVANAGIGSGIGLKDPTGIISGITSVGDAIKFLFSTRGLMTIGGGIVLLMGIYLLVSKVGLAAADATPAPIKDAANAAANAAVPETRVLTAAHKAGAREGRVQAARREGRSAGRRSIAEQKPIARRTRRVQLEADSRPRRAVTYDPSTSEIPF